MKTNFKFTGTEPNDKLREYTETKIEAFKKLMTDEQADAAICAIEFRCTAKHHNGNICTAEVTLETEGKLYRVSKEEPSLEKAIDKVKDDILRSLRAEKEKSIEASRKGSGKLKKLIQGE